MKINPVFIIPLIVVSIGLYYILYLFFKKILTPKSINPSVLNNIIPIDLNYVKESETLKKEIPHVKLSIEHEIKSIELDSIKYVENSHIEDEDNIPPDVVIEITDPKLKVAIELINKEKVSLSETVLESGKFIFKNGNDEKIQLAISDDERRAKGLETIKRSGFGK